MESSQMSALSLGLSRSRSRVRSRSPSPSPARYAKQQRRRARIRLYKSILDKNKVYQFTRVTSTTPVTSQENPTNNYWYLNNRDTNGIAYGGGIPTPFLGNQISFYFDFSTVHMDLYSAGGALLTQVEYGLPAVGDFAALFEEFKIDWVQIDCFSSQENAYRFGATFDVPQNSQILYYVKDYNDADSTSLTSLMQQQDVMTWQPCIGNSGTYHRTIRLRPRCNFTVANSAGAVGGTAQMSRNWLQTEDSQTVPHYGVKMAACNFFPTNATTNAASCYLGFSFTYHFSFRNTK